MRLQLICAAWSLLVPSVLWAQTGGSDESEATARMLVYADDDATSVVTSAVDAEAALPAGFSVGAHALVDVVSSASVDVVSAATDRWDETRVEVGARGRTTVAGLGVSLGYTRSQENDWLSHSVSVAASKELFARNTVVSGRYAVTLNTVGRAMDPNFERSLDAHHVEVGLSQLLDAKTRIGGSYSLQALSGYLSSPYRFVRASDGSGGPESHPDSRIRHALSVYGLRSLSDRVAARGSYRFYIDDWGLRSHTASVRFGVELADRFVVGAEGRAYIQNEADFYQSTYASSFRFMTFDRELSSFWDAGGTADLAVTIGPVIADAKLGVIHYKFANFPALPSRNALIAGGGARFVW